MTTSLITRLAGPAAIAAGTLMVAAQVVLSTFDMDQHIATSTNPLFQVTQVFYLLGFIALMVFLFATSRWLEEKGGKFGVFATLAALSAPWPSAATSGSRPSRSRGSPTRCPAPSTPTRPSCWRSAPSRATY